MIKKICFSPYKCFLNGLTIDPPKLVNLVIGRNNSGKSSFLDYICSFYLNKTEKISGFSAKVEFNVTKDLLKYLSTSLVNMSYFYRNIDYKQELLDKNLVLYLTKHNGAENISLLKESVPSSVSNYVNVSISNPTELSNRLIKKFDDYFKIAAERDIRPEKQDNNKIISPNGDGLVSKLLFHTINSHGKRQIRKNILNGINQLLEGESHFSDLLILENDDGNYEIKLTTDNNQEIALSEMGSGLKTIIFVLFVLNSRLLLKQDTILMFEELENNLHPRIQRRLFDMIYQYSIENKCPVFITSHSNVSINVFYEKDDVMIFHVLSDGTSSTIKTIRTKNEEREIADDLGIKASDIFQSNGIIWVEGPSDRVYLNKWINLIDPVLKENVHYTFLYYGGRLLSHYTASEQEQKDFIDILLTNRNSAILIDSDIKESGDTINSTKQRIVDEFAKSNRFCWVTKGREIENYLSKNALNRKYSSQIEKQISVFDDFKDYIKNLEPNFKAIKVKFARALDFTDDDLNILDLKEKVTELVANIKKWNY